MSKWHYLENIGKYREHQRWSLTDTSVESEHSGEYHKASQQSNRCIHGANPETRADDVLILGKV